jgi:hypothetical protein
MEIEPPLSMAGVGRRLGFYHGELYAKFPKLCYKISLRHREYLKKMYDADRTKREKEVRQDVIQIHRKGVYPMARLVAELLNKPAYFGRRDVAVVIRKTREELDSKNK